MGRQDVLLASLCPAEHVATWSYTIAMSWTACFRAAESRPPARPQGSSICYRASGSSGAWISFCMNDLWLSQHVFPSSPKSAHVCACEWFSTYLHGACTHACVSLMTYWKKPISCCCHSVQAVILHVLCSSVVAWCRQARRLYLVPVDSLAMHRACILYVGMCRVCLRGMIIRS